MWKYAKYLLVAVSVITFLYMLINIGWIQAFGWVYSLAFALSALPQAIKSYKQGHSDGVADGMMQLWILGELAGLVYGFGLWQMPIVFNCALNTVFVGAIIYYRLFPRKSGTIKDKEIPMK